MKDAEVVVALASTAAPSLSTPPTEDSPNRPADPERARRVGLARALQLGPLLQVHVIVDHTGWLSRDVEIVYNRERGSTIRPITVRVGRDARDDDVLADGGALGTCRMYNDALNNLRQLATRLAAVMREGQLTVIPGSPLDEAQREISRLDALIVRRQATHMGHGVVRLHQLRAEIEFYECRRAYLAPIVIAAERTAYPSWDGDTQEIVRDD